MAKTVCEAAITAEQTSNRRLKMAPVSEAHATADEALEELRLQLESGSHMLTVAIGSSDAADHARCVNRILDTWQQLKTKPLMLIVGPNAEMTDRLVSAWSRFPEGAMSDRSLIRTCETGTFSRVLPGSIQYAADRLDTAVPSHKVTSPVITPSSQVTEKIR